VLLDTDHIGGTAAVSEDGGDRAQVSTTGPSAPGRWKPTTLATRDRVKQAIGV
jgi:hypothetical protein